MGTKLSYVYVCKESKFLRWIMLFLIEMHSLYMPKEENNFSENKYVSCETFSIIGQSEISFAQVRFRIHELTIEKWGVPSLFWNPHRES